MLRTSSAAHAGHGSPRLLIAVSALILLPGLAAFILATSPAESGRGAAAAAPAPAADLRRSPAAAAPAATRDKPPCGTRRDIDAVLRPYITATASHRFAPASGAADPGYRFEAAALAAREARHRALAVLGPCAPAEPSLHALFHPLHATLGDLSTDHQVVIREAELEREAALSRRDANPAAIQSRFLAQLAAQLPAADIDAYRLQADPLAFAIRRSIHGLDAAPFARVFRALEVLTGPDQPATANTAAWQTLRRTLTTEELRRLWQPRDPVYRALNGVGRRLGLRADSIDSIYQVFLATGHGNPAVGTDPQAVSALRERRVAELTGATAARRLLRELAWVSLTLQGPTPAAL